MLEKCFGNDILIKSNFSAGTNASEVVVSRSRISNAVQAVDGENWWKHQKNQKVDDCKPQIYH